MSGLQCPKRLYLEIHQPELAINSDQTESLFTQGHRVGEVARSLVPNGVMIEMTNGFDQAIQETQNLLKSSLAPPLFEATFFHNHVLVRADLFFTQSNGYRLVEVKASTSVKDYHHNDCAIQAWVIEGAGYPIQKVELAHVDNSFVYPGDLKYDGLFFHEDITNTVNKLKKEVPQWIKQFQKMLAGDVPQISVGPHCSDPFDCPFAEHCHPPGPNYPVDILPRGGSISDKLIEQGISDIRDIPDHYLDNPIHERIRQATISGQPFVGDEIKAHLNSLDYSRYYLDFETIGTAVPLWPGTRPYQTHLPFQWSVHIEPEPGVLAHEEFLDLSGKNPMKPLAEKLISVLGNKGPIFVYSAFEKTVLRQIASFYPKLKKKLEALEARIEDLLPLVRAYYYHPDMMGSWSIKNVLPTVAPDLDYQQLEEIQDGGCTQAAYLEASELSSESERYNSLWQNLLKYCEMDTLAMVRVVQFFSYNYRTGDNNC